MKKLLIFHPFAGANYFSKALYSVAYLLKEQGWDVDHFGCDGALDRYCIVYAANQLTENGPVEAKQHLCELCRKTRSQLHASGTFNQKYLLEQFLTAEDKIAAQNLVDQYQNTPLDEICVDGINIGRIASYDFILIGKIPDATKLSREQREIFNKYYLYNAFLAQTALKKFFTEHRYDGIVMYNSYYGVHHLACAVAKQCGQTTSFIHGGFNLKRKHDSLYFSKDLPGKWNLEMMDYYKKNTANLIIDEKYFQFPLDHIEHVLAAKSIHTFSSSRQSELSPKFAALKDSYRKTVLVSLSSADEAHAADYSGEFGQYLANARGVFPTQFEWIQTLVDYFRDKNDVAVIFRFHPREYPNMGKKGPASENVERLTQIFRDVPKHIILNTPDDHVSIYDLFAITDLHLCAQTTVGLESSWFGIPTLSYITGIGNYPMDQIAFYEPTKEKYFEKLAALLHAPFCPNLDAIEKSLHWLIFLHKYVVYNFDSGKNNLSAKIGNRLARYFGNPFRHYARKIFTPPEEKQKLVSFFSEGKELFPITKDFYSLSQISAHPDNAVFYQKYLLGLFKIWTKADFLPGKDAGYDFVYDSGNADAIQIQFDEVSVPAFSGKQLVLPKHDRVLRSLGDALVHHKVKRELQ